MEEEEKGEETLKHENIEAQVTEILSAHNEADCFKGMICSIGRSFAYKTTFCTSCSYVRKYSLYSDRDEVAVVFASATSEGLLQWRIMCFVKKPSSQHQYCSSLEAVHCYF